MHSGRQASFGYLTINSEKRRSSFGPELSETTQWPPLHTGFERLDFRRAHHLAFRIDHDAQQVSGRALLRARHACPLPRLNPKHLATLHFVKLTAAID